MLFEINNISNDCSEYYSIGGAGISKYEYNYILYIVNISKTSLFYKKYKYFE